jgi:hypothetical protein
LALSYYLKNVPTELDGGFFSVAIGASYLALGDFGFQPLNRPAMASGACYRHHLVIKMVEFQDYRVGLAAVHAWMFLKIFRHPLSHPLPILQIVCGSFIDIGRAVSGVMPTLIFPIAWLTPRLEFYSAISFNPFASKLIF